jgi:hypothetical protein
MHRGEFFDILKENHIVQEFSNIKKKNNIFEVQEKHLVYRIVSLDYGCSDKRIEN